MPKETSMRAAWVLGAVIACAAGCSPPGQSADAGPDVTTITDSGGNDVVTQDGGSDSGVKDAGNDAATQDGGSDSGGCQPCVLGTSQVGACCVQ